jgi:capsular exopolysaccharide synthesis family protein
MFERLSGDRDPSRMIVALGRRWWVIVLLAAIAGAGAYFLANRKTKMYSATAALLFQDSNLDQKLFGNQVLSSTDPTREAATNQSLVELPTVARLVATQLGIPASTVQSEVTVGSDSLSDVLTVQATAPSPKFAARLANAYVLQFIEFRRQADQSQLSAAQQLVSTQLAKIPSSQQNSATAQNLQKTKTELQLLDSLQTGNALQVQVARPPSSASSPTPTKDAFIGVVLGLLVGVGLVVLLERRDRRLKTMPEIEQLYGIPIIGTVPESSSLRTRGGVGSPREQDAFRMMRAQLRYFDVDRDVKRVMVTSADSGEGKSLVSLNLARAAGGADNQRTLLIEADLRRPSLAGTLELNGVAGLAELLSQSRDLASGLRELVVTPESVEDYRVLSRFEILLAGAVPPNPVELLESQRMAELMELVGSMYDIVIIDTPPIGVVSDPIPLVHQVDGVLIIARLGRSRRDHAASLMKQLHGLNAHILGLVVNSFSSPGGGYSEYYGYAGREPDKGTRPWRRPPSRRPTRIK